MQPDSSNNRLMAAVARQSCRESEGKNTEPVTLIAGWLARSKGWHPASMFRTGREPQSSTSSFAATGSKHAEVAYIFGLASLLPAAMALSERAKKAIEGGERKLPVRSR